MIIAELCGGLGNQLFQYAAATALASESRRIWFDTSFFLRQRKRRLDLLEFRVNLQVAPQWLIKFTSASLRPKPQKLRDKLPARLRHKVFYRFVDRESGYDPNFAEQRGNLVLSGFFQSERYFASIASSLRSQFIPIADPSQKNSELLQHITDTGSSSVFVHVRRGDYASESEANIHHGLCSGRYYDASAAQIASTVKSPHFFVFSDDIAWTRTHLNLARYGRQEFVSHNFGTADWADLRLMSACRNAIIANSSFSWWGAWLGDDGSKDRHVIAPKQWFAKDAWRCHDIVPPRWIRI